MQLICGNGDIWNSSKDWFRLKYQHQSVPKLAALLSEVGKMSQNIWRNDHFWVTLRTRIRTELGVYGGGISLGIFGRDHTGRVRRKNRLQATSNTFVRRKTREIRFGHFCWFFGKWWFWLTFRQLKKHVIGVLGWGHPTRISNMDLNSGFGQKNAVRPPSKYDFGPIQILPISPKSRKNHFSGKTPTIRKKIAKMAWAYFGFDFRRKHLKPSPDLWGIVLYPSIRWSCY